VKVGRLSGPDFRTPLLDMQGRRWRMILGLYDYYGEMVDASKGNVPAGFCFPFEPGYRIGMDECTFF
jgi:hypothetical protein